MPITTFLKKVSGRHSADSAVLFPPMLGSPKRLSQGIFQFRYRTPAQVDFEIQATSDFKTWITVEEGTGGEEEQEFVERQASKFSARFYRVVAGGMQSADVIGYVSLVLRPGFSLISNPLHAENNSVGALFKNWPEGTRLNKFNTGLFRLEENGIHNGKWTDPTDILLPGQGAIFFNPTADYKWHCFVGEVTQGRLSIPLPAGFLMCSSLVPQRGNLREDLGFPVMEGDVVHLFDAESQKYTIHPFGANGWEGPAPVIGLAESFWVAKKSAENWTREFYIHLEEPDPLAE